MLRFGGELGLQVCFPISNAISSSITISGDGGAQGYGSLTAFVACRPRVGWLTRLASCWIAHHRARTSRFRAQMACLCLRDHHGLVLHGLDAAHGQSQGPAICARHPVANFAHRSHHSVRWSPHPGCLPLPAELPQRRRVGWHRDACVSPSFAFPSFLLLQSTLQASLPAHSVLEP